MLDKTKLEQISEPNEQWKELIDESKNVNKSFLVSSYGRIYSTINNRLVKLYLNIDALDEDRVEGWVRVAAKNLGIDYQRKSQRFDWNELDEDLRAEEMELPTLAEEEKQERNHFFSGSDGCTERS